MLVPEKGLEPSQPFGYWNLNPARLPISPLGPFRGLLRIITIRSERPKMVDFGAPRA